MPLSNGLRSEERAENTFRPHRYFVAARLHPLLDNLANLVTVKAQEKKDLEVLFATAQDVPRFLVGDPLRLGQILINLANNAVKFTEEGEVVVNVTTDQHNGSKADLRFSVEDTGIGIPRDKQKDVFSAFKQVDAKTTSQYGGTGLGLAMTRNIVEQARGRIYFETETGAGTTFFITLPLFENG